MLYNRAYRTFTAQDQMQGGAVDGISGPFLLPARYREARRGVPMPALYTPNTKEKTCNGPTGAAWVRGLGRGLSGTIECCGPITSQYNN